MRIKKHPNKNRYLLTEGGIWVRDYTQDNVVRQDINQIVDPRDHAMILENEHKNARIGMPQIDNENIYHRNVLIVSNGYGFKERHRLLSKIPSDVTVIAVNGALSSWELIGKECPTEEKRNIDYYVVNNPYQECLGFLPRKNRYYPRCIASVRTNPKFISHYKQRSTIYRYHPTSESGFSGLSNNALFTIDDYRNPICAALGLAYRFDAERIMLFCCDASFADERPGSIPVRDGLFSYPQQRTCQQIIDGYIYWMRQVEYRDIVVGDHSSCWKYENAEYIEDDGLTEFFKG